MNLSISCEQLQPLIVAYQSGNLSNGGLQSLTEILTHLQMPCRIVTNCQSAHADRWKDAGADVTLMPLWANRGGTMSRVITALRTNVRICRMVRAQRIRIVSCNDIRSILAAGLGARLGGARVVWSVRDTRQPGQKYGVHWKAMGRLADRIVVLSADMKRRVAASFGSAAAAIESKITPIYSIVDPDRFKPVSPAARKELRRKLGIPPDGVAVVVAGAFMEKKRQREIISTILPALAPRVPQAHWYFVGDCDPSRNDYARACREEVQKRSLDQTVTFVGYEPHVERWYQAADCLVIASTQEGLARCMIEAMACSVPVVTFDVASATEIVGCHAAGVVVPENDFPALAAAVEQMASEPGRRAELGANGAKAARRLFAPEAVIAKYRDLFRELGAGLESPTK